MSNLATEMRELATTTIDTDRVIIGITNEIQASASKGQFNLTVQIRTDIASKVRQYFEEQGFVVQMIAHSIPEAKTIINISWE